MREGTVLRKRFGIGGERTHSLSSIAKEFALSRERIRQIESAPIRPRVALKAAITTAIAVGITGLAAAAVEYDVISFREWVR